MNNINVHRFEEDLFDGKNFQNEVLADVQKKYPRAHVVEGKFKDFDIMVPETGKTIEAKYDRRSDDTGNYFIEYEFNGEPSGIAATKADWYVIGNYMWWCWVDVSELKAALQPKFKFWKRELVGEDGTIIKGVVTPMPFVWKLPSTKKVRKPSYQEMWEDMGSPLDFTIDDMKFIDSYL